MLVMGQWFRRLFYKILSVSLSLDTPLLITDLIYLFILVIEDPQMLELEIISSHSFMNLIANWTITSKMVLFKTYFLLTLHSLLGLSFFIFPVWSKCSVTLGLDKKYHSWWHVNPLSHLYFILTVLWYKYW